MSPNRIRTTSWLFDVGQTRTIAAEPVVAFSLLAIFDNEVYGLVEIQNQGESPTSKRGCLIMNVPKILVRSRDNFEPKITATLRKIDSGKAYLQISVAPSIRQMRRQ